MLILGLALPVQLKPPVQLPLIGPVCLLLIQPGLQADALYPPQVLRDGEVAAPDRIVGKLDEAGAREIIALSAACQPPIGGAATVDGAGDVMGPCRALAAVATVTGPVKR